MKHNRILEIDALRGLAMILVIYSHLTIFLQPYYSALNQVFITFRMPLFFFISGYFAYKAAYTKDVLKKRSINRLLRQLYPTVILFILFCHIFYSSDPIQESLLDIHKHGYWFTLVSVEMFFITAPLLFIFYKKDIPDLYKAFILISVSLIFMVGYLFAKKLQNPAIDTILNLFSGVFLARYLFFFALGMVAKMYDEKFSSIVSKGYFPILALVLFAIFIYYPLPDPMTYHTAIAGLLFLFSIFKLMGRRQARILKPLAIIGGATLEIYLLHYFVISTALNLGSLTWLAKTANTVYEFPCLFIIAVGVAIIPLLVVRGMKILRINEFFFPSGKKPIFNKKLYNSIRIGSKGNE